MVTFFWYMGDEVAVPAVVLLLWAEDKSKVFQTHLINLISWSIRIEISV